MSDTRPLQYCLGVALKDDTTFASFQTSPANRLPVAALEALVAGAGEPMITLWGPRGAGVSHLLQAACHALSQRGGRAQYLPLAVLQTFDPQAVLEGMDEQDLVCIDNLEAVASHALWEPALFHFYNRRKDAGARLLLGLGAHPNSVAWNLADLKSRILGTALYFLAPADDETLDLALKRRAHARGLAISDEVANYILHRVERNPHSVFELLDRLDTASLQHQRRITIPFVKAVLGL